MGTATCASYTLAEVISAVMGAAVGDIEVEFVAALEHGVSFTAALGPDVGSG